MPEASRRLGELLLLTKHVAEVVVGIDVVGVQDERLADERDGVTGLAGLKCQYAQEVMRFRVGGIGTENLLIQRRRLLEAARLVILDGTRERLGNRGHATTPCAAPRRSSGIMPLYRGSAATSAGRLLRRRARTRARP